MIRTIISLDPADKAWLDAKATELGLPMTAVVREAVALLRQSETANGARSLDELLEATRGAWKMGDGLAWQRQSRAGWDRPT